MLHRSSCYWISILLLWGSNLRHPTCSQGKACKPAGAFASVPNLTVHLSLANFNCLVIVALLQRIVSQINQELMKDGIHPSRDGYKALAQCVITDFVKPIAIKDIEFSPPSEYEKYMPFPPPSHPPESPPQPSMPPSPPLSLPSPPLPSPPLPPSEPAQPTPTPAAPMPTKRAIRRRPQNKRRRPKGDIDSRQTPRPVPATSENTEAQTEAMKRTASTNEDTLRSPDIVVIDSPPLRISQETVVPSFIQDAVPAAKQRAFVSQNLDTAARVAEQPARARSAPSSSESPPKGGTRGTLMVRRLLPLLPCSHSCSQFPFPAYLAPPEPLRLRFLI